MSIIFKQTLIVYIVLFDNQFTLVFDWDVVSGDNRLQIYGTRNDPYAEINVCSSVKRLKLVQKSKPKCQMLGHEYKIIVWH